MGDSVRYPVMKTVKDAAAIYGLQLVTGLHSPPLPNR